MSIAYVKIFLALLSIMLFGCRGAFQPLPYYYESWSKPGATDIDVKKIILECGNYNPYGTYPEDNRPSRSEMALRYYCIVNSGYTYLSPFKGGKPDNNSWCRNNPELEACQSGAIIPTPSSELRLNGRYCRDRLSHDECMKNAAVETGVLICSRRNYESPPPECLP